MCGDGTNDVGALKHADVGVSILSNSCFKKKSEIRAEQQAAALTSGRPSQSPALNARQAPTTGGRRGAGEELRLPDRAQREAAMTPRERALAKHRANIASTQELLQKTLKEIDDEQLQIVKLGDASIAAPFTSKMSSIQSGIYTIILFCGHVCSMCVPLL